MSVLHEDELETLWPSQARRFSALFALAVVGGILIWHGFAGTGFLSRTMAAFLAFADIWLAIRILHASAMPLRLRTDGLYSDDGTLVAALSNILRVERGTFAFKPSNGFLIILRAPMHAVWKPGMWWRFGRRVGVGGVTSKVDGKRMADRLSALLASQNSHP